MSNTVESEKLAECLTIGLGKLIKEYREENGLTQEQMASELGTKSGARIKDYELGQKIGKQGFTMLMLIKLAMLKKSNVQTVLQEIIVRSSQSKYTAMSEFQQIEGVLTEDTRKTLIKYINTEDKLFGNHVRWATSLSATLLETPSHFKADAEFGILKSMREQDIEVYDEDFNKSRSEELFKFSLDPL